MKRAWAHGLVFAMASAAATLCGAPREAFASVSIAVTFDALVHESNAVVLVTAVEQKSIWEGGRIYTYSRLHVDSAIAGDLEPENEVWVRTLGGAVGKVGQIVEGEAGFAVGRPSLVFLRRASTGNYVVTARAQGQFGLYVDDQSAVHVQKSGALGGLFAPRGANANLPLASDVIHGRVVSDAARDIATAWTRLHAP
jgi:hypothetical protein